LFFFTKPYILYIVRDKRISSRSVFVVRKFWYEIFSIVFICDLVSLPPLKCLHFLKVSYNKGTKVIYFS